ncbi:dehydrogenase/reductase SDR family member 4 isoform X1 [Misgurnus anguillicaudatus]|uniref:dehydrogenase/reductase SDR family member 4 isoform X1 n=2 Tax=Misgurnus anguillicaudatus TaxID=75329 RepID=UPI003CCFBC99
MFKNIFQLSGIRVSLHQASPFPAAAVGLLGFELQLSAYGCSPLIVPDTAPFLTAMLKAVTRSLWLKSVAGIRMMSHHSPLSGKVAIVTGSTDGIGLAAAEALGRRGAHVVVSSRRQTNVDKAVSLLRSKNIKVTGTTCDVGNAEDREKLINMTVEQCGGVDILVNNAAMIQYIENILDSTEDVWDKIFGVNVKSQFLLTKLVVPYMEKRGGGSVVFVSSVAGYMPIQGLGVYSVSKTALLGLTRALAPDLAHSNIRVNSVAPGLIKTPFSSMLWENENLLNGFLKLINMKRIGKPEEIGGVIAFLCTDEASYVTGETFSATGGISCKL